MAGAKRCLVERGYARTTARDIVAASGTNLASIGYHFGSKEALLNEALIEASGEWGGQLEKVLAEAGEGLRPGSVERFQVIWSGVVELFAQNRGLWAASFEVFAQIEHLPELRRQLADGLEQARLGLAHIFHHPDDEAARSLGCFYQAMLTGVIAQYLIDPERAPTGPELALALRTITADAFRADADQAGTTTAVTTSPLSIR